MSADPIVEISEAVPGAVKIARTDLRETDLVFDVAGGTHALKRVRHYAGHTRGERVDGWPVYLEGDATITVVRRCPHGVTETETTKCRECVAARARA